MPLYDRALRGVYPPGSTIKPFMALAALHTGKRTPEFTIAENLAKVKWNPEQDVVRPAANPIYREGGLAVAPLQVRSTDAA